MIIYFFSFYKINIKIITEIRGCEVKAIEYLYEITENA